MSGLKTREVWEVITNSDRIEGKGLAVHLAYCELEATARRLARGKGVMGSNAHVYHREVYISPNNESLVLRAVRVEQPNNQDRELQKKITEREKVLKRAKAAGLSDDDIKLLRREGEK